MLLIEPATGQFIVLVTVPATVWANSFNFTEELDQVAGP